MKYLIILVACMALFSWYVHPPKTEQDRIDRVNDTLFVDGGYLTKTHLYIHWPAEYTKPSRFDNGGKEIVPALTLKIPLDYLNQDDISWENGVKTFLHDKWGISVEEDPKEVDYISRIHQATFIAEREIMSVYLRLQPGAKPYAPSLAFDDDPPEVKREKLGRFHNSYTVIINGNYHFADQPSERLPNVPAYEAPPEFTCDQDGSNTCHLKFGIKGRLVKISGIGEALDPYGLTWFNKKYNIPAQKYPEGVPKWRSKFDPTQALLNSFVLPEDSPEVKKYFQ
jgi:hypothetical protein